MPKLRVLPLFLFFIAIKSFAVTVSFTTLKYIPPAQSETNFSVATETPKISDFLINGAGLVRKGNETNDSGIYTLSTMTVTDYYGDKVKVPSGLDLIIQDKTQPDLHFATFELIFIGMIGKVPQYQFVLLRQKGLCIIADENIAKFTTRNCSKSGQRNLDNMVPIKPNDNIGVFLVPTDDE